MGMKYSRNNFYIITGGPGVGKTTLLNELENTGYRTVEEDARQIIKEQIKNKGNGLPWGNRELYTDLMISASLQSYEAVSDVRDEIVFFDRGIIDAFCYARMIQLPVTSEMKNITTNYLYNPQVFILPPWPEIYRIDGERKQTWEEAAETYNVMRSTYIDYGYTPIVVPPDTPQARANFILRNIIQSDFQQ